MNRMRRRFRSSRPLRWMAIGSGILLSFAAWPGGPRMLLAEEIENRKSQRSSIRRAAFEASSDDASSSQAVQSRVNGPLPRETRFSQKQDLQPTNSEADEPSPESQTPLPLPRRRSVRSPGDSLTAHPSATRTLTSMLGSLGIVLGLFAILVWFVKRSAPRTAVLLPKEVVEVFGRATVSPRQSVHVVRFGSKVLLLSVSPNGVEALSEITEPTEVERLVGICRQVQPDSVTNSFRQILSQLSSEPARPGFVEPTRREREVARATIRRSPEVDHA